MMSNVRTSAKEDAGPNRHLIDGAGALALLSASCCILPIGVSIIGLGGAWLTWLAPLIAHRGPILIGVAVAVLWGRYRVLRPRACAARKRSSPIWTSLATIAFIVSPASPYWEGSAEGFMWDLWRANR